MARRPSDRMLKRWLATGRPRRVDRLISTDPDIALRLDAMTAIAEHERDAIEGVVAPGEDFEVRIIDGVRKRSEAQSTAGLVVDLLGLGFHVGGAFVKKNPNRSDPSGE